MYRIILMVVRLFYKVPYYLMRIWWLGTRKNFNLEENYAFIKKVTKAANRAGRVKIESYGLENIPKENGFIFFPNHQGMFDALVFLESCPVPFSVVYKKEVSNVILLNQVFKALHAIAIDREDIKQSLQVINQMTEEVKKGRNFLIFPEGTRSRMPINFLRSSISDFISSYSVSLLFKSDICSRSCLFSSTYFSESRKRSITSPTLSDIALENCLIGLNTVPSA